jgi:rare lipoprotein A
VRTRITVAFAALIAAATLVALPGPVGSRTPSLTGNVDDLAFAPLVPEALDPATGDASGIDAAWRSDGSLEADSVLVEPGAIAYPVARPRVDQPGAPSRFVVKRVWHWDPETSFYGPGFYGGKTACGDVYTKEIVGVAHRTLPCGTRVQFRNPANGRVVTARVIDRGPYVSGRTWDLSGALCQKLDHCYTGPIEWRMAGG